MSRVCEHIYRLDGLTFAGSVGAAQNGALLYSSERGKQLANIVFSLLLAEHANEQLSVCTATAHGERETKHVSVGCDNPRGDLFNNQTNVQTIIIQARWN